MKQVIQCFSYVLSSFCFSFISAAQIPDAPMQANWYKTSVIIFSRPDINNENTAEKLFVDAQRMYPGNAQAFPFNTELSEYYNPLSLRTSLALKWPTLSMRDPILNQLPPDILEEAILLDRVDVPVNMAIQPIDPVILQEQSDIQVTQESPINEIMQAESTDSNEQGRQITQDLPKDIQAQKDQPEEPSAMEIALEAFTAYEDALINQSLIPLPDEEHLLKQELTRLKRRDDYQVLYTTSWYQAIPDRNNPAPVLVQAGARKSGIFELEGTIAITLGRYLHVKAELWLHDLSDTPLETESVQDIQWMQINESRRMRSTELHYLDHPKFGVLVRVDPVEIPEQLNKMWREAHADEKTAKPSNSG